MLWAIIRSSPVGRLATRMTFSPLRKRTSRITSPEGDRSATTTSRRTHTRGSVRSAAGVIWNGGSGNKLVGFAIQRAHDVGVRGLLFVLEKYPHRFGGLADGV